MTAAAGRSAQYEWERHIKRLLGDTKGHHLTVYYARRGDYIKVGTSADPVKRCADLGARLIATEPGGRRVEGQRLRQLSPARVRCPERWWENEWFDGNDPIVNVMVARAVFLQTEALGVDVLTPALSVPSRSATAGAPSSGGTDCGVVGSVVSGEVAPDSAARRESNQPAAVKATGRSVRAASFSAEGR